jgi:hypothetical protein
MQYTVERFIDNTGLRSSVTHHNRPNDTLDENTSGPVEVQHTLDSSQPLCVRRGLLLTVCAKNAGTSVTRVQVTNRF